MGLLLGHRWEWDEAGVLHRDVSITNIMFYRTLEGIIGVLCDWDLSDTKEAIGEEKPLAVDERSYEAIDDTINYEREESKDVSEQPAEDDDSKKGKARYCAGTVPFMALDLLAPGPAPVHLYRHDLESFFWVLVYFVAIHDPEQHTLGRINQWVDSNLQIVRQDTIFDRRRMQETCSQQGSSTLQSLHQHDLLGLAPHVHGCRE